MAGQKLGLDDLRGSEHVPWRLGAEYTVNACILRSMYYGDLVLKPGNQNYGYVPLLPIPMSLSSPVYSTP